MQVVCGNFYESLLQHQLQSWIHSPWICEVVASGKMYVPDFPLLEHVMFSWLPVWVVCNNNTFMHKSSTICRMNPTKRNNLSIWSIITCQMGIGLNHACTECQMSRSRHIWLELHQFHLTWMRIAEPHHMMIIMVHWVQNPSFRPTEGKACFISVFENMRQYPHDFFIISVFFQPLTSMV